MLADRKYPLRVAGLFALYVLAGKLCLSLASLHPSASPVWPPTGIALAAFLTLGYRVWPAIFAGALVVNITTTTGSVATSVAIALGNTLEGLLGAWLVVRYANGARAFDHAQDVFKFAALAGLLSSLVSATIGVVSLALGGYARWDDFDGIWLTWWLGDATGALIFAPLLILLVRDGWSAPSDGRLREAAALWLTTILIGLAVFGEGLAHLGFMTLPLTFLCTPPLVWAAVRFRQREAAILVAVLSGIAIWETLRGLGPLANVPTNESLLLLQVFMGTVSVMAISAGAVVEERRRVEHEREFLLVRAQAARAEAEAANRAKDEFLAMLGHELRNPLAAIISAVSVLDRIGTQDDVAVRAREAIRHQITHLGRLVDDLLDIVHVTAGEITLAREPLNLATSVQRSVSDLASTGRLERHVVDVRAEPVWANADPTRLNQIVSNLLSNAIKYTSPGGTIRVRVVGEASLAVIGVSDTGIGIPPKLLSHMFDLPQQGERRLVHAQGGLGVGLTLVRRLVELHGGQVEAFSAGPGHGSEFVVRLPRIAPARQTESQSVLRVIGNVAAVRR